MQTRICRPAARRAGQHVEDTLLAGSVGVDEHVVEDEDLRAATAGDQFLGYRETQAEEQLFLGTLGEIVEGDEFVVLATEALNLEGFVQEDLAVAVAADLAEACAETRLERGEDGAGRGLLAPLDEIVDTAGRPGYGRGRGQPARRAPRV